jgi:hypothetical protein
VECSQGDGLGLNGNSYPFTTSRDCNPSQALFDIHATDYSSNVIKYCVIRPYPIRINNKPKNDKDDFMYTGDFYGAKEINWGVLAKRSKISLNVIQKNENSTTTCQLRRVAEFSIKQFEEMLLDTNPDKLIINFSQHNHYGLLNLSQKKAEYAVKKFNDGKFNDESVLSVISGINTIQAYLGELELLFPKLTNKLGLD